MKRYLSSLILLGALALTLAGVLAWRGAAGLLRRETDRLADRLSGESALCRVEEGALRLNVNEADAGTLRLLNGIGEGLSQAIVDYREANGPFRSVDELMNVRGIGEGKLAAIRDQIYCE